MKTVKGPTELTPDRIRERIQSGDLKIPRWPDPPEGMGHIWSEAFRIRMAVAKAYLLGSKSYRDLAGEAYRKKWSKVKTPNRNLIYGHVTKALRYLLENGLIQEAKRKK